MKTLALAIFTAFLLAGCTWVRYETIYYYDAAYPKAVYDYLNEEGNIDEQISSLQQIVQSAYEQGAKVPPGLYAQLGLLYLDVGNNEQAKSYFKKEISDFPESRAYIEFLLSQKSTYINKKATK